MSTIGIVADDLTGATTVGVLLARSGISTAAFFNEKSVNNVKQHQAIVMCSDSRALPKKAAKEKVKSMVRVLKEEGTIHFSKRIDTTLRGGIGYEVDAMIEELPSDTIAVMVPSMPQSNRIVVGGYSIIDGVALSKTPVANDVRTPVTETYIPALLGKQTTHQIGLIQLGSVLSGKNVLKQALQSEREKGAKILIVDAITIEDVELIAQAVTELKWNVLAVDPGPFTEKLSLLRVSEQENVNFKKMVLQYKNNGTVLVIAGSTTLVTKKQMEMLMQKEGTFHVPINVESLIDNQVSESEVQRVAAEVCELIENKKYNVILLETALTSNILNLSAIEQKLGLAKGEAAKHIISGLGKIVAEALNHREDEIRGIYMTGGDTMVNVLNMLGADGIELVDYVIPQADLGRIIGGKYNNLVVVGKGGLTGTEHTAIDIVNRIFEESGKINEMNAIEA